MWQAAQHSRHAMLLPGAATWPCISRCVRVPGNRPWVKQLSLILVICQNCLQFKKWQYQIDCCKSFWPFPKSGQKYAKFTEFWCMSCVCLWPFVVRTTFPKEYLPYLSANTLQFSTSMGIGQCPGPVYSCQVSIIPTYLLERYVLETKNAFKMRLYIW